MDRFPILDLSMLGILSFIFNSVWEWSQCIPFFIHADKTSLFLLMLEASFADVLITFVILGASATLTGGLHRNRFSLSRKGYFLVEILAVGVAVGIEKWALATGRWQYTASTPIIPGLQISLIPVLQLMLLIPAHAKCY
jgi:hypothetical protein